MQLHIFHLCIFYWNKNRFSSEKQSVPLVLPNVWQKPQFCALQEQQVSWLSFSDSLLPLLLVYSVRSAVPVPAGRPRTCPGTHLGGWAAASERHRQAALARHTLHIKPQHAETDSLLPFWVMSAFYSAPRPAMRATKTCQMKNITLRDPCSLEKILWLLTETFP